MSRASWSSSTGSDAEVRHHFDQPFDYDPRRFVDKEQLEERRHGSERYSQVDNEDEEVDASSDGRTDFSLPNESLDSFQAAFQDQGDAEPEQPMPQAQFLDDLEDQSNQAICRICLESASSDVSGGESLGRLLSPCRCKGTMKYVHATCLDQWRAASARSSSAVACDQCGAPYRFRKSKFVGLATSPTLLFIVSLCLFLLLIWTVGVTATFFMDIYDRPASSKPSTASHKSKSKGWWPWRGSAFEQHSLFDPVEPDAWSYLDADYSPGIWSYSNLMYEPAAYVKLIKEAVRSFASGEAVEAVREVVGLQDAPEATQSIEQDPHEGRGFWSALKQEWLYGDGGLWEKKASLPSDKTSPAEDAITPAATGPGASQTRSRQKYDARAASDANDPNARKRRRQKAAKASRKPTSSQAEPQGWLNKLLVQFSVGFSLVGILSFVNLLVGASFIGPINLHNFGLGRSFARMTSGGRGGRNGNQEGVNIASILIVLLVIIGVVRALHVVYKLVRKAARRGLSRLEAVIVDWNYEGDADVVTHDVLATTRDEVDHDPQPVRHRRAFFLPGDD
ncbi:RING-CH-type domain-containing protein [Pseudozyma hubeiensis]|nr:RING-CH-type domain-containing protein [Pseudozyma hubeiensis]